MRKSKKKLKADKPRFEKGIAVRRKNWSHCVVEIIDVGITTFWGRLVDLKTDEVIEPSVIYPIDDDWYLVLEVEDLLRVL